MVALCSLKAHAQGGDDGEDGAEQQSLEELQARRNLLPPGNCVMWCHMHEVSFMHEGNG